MLDIKKTRRSLMNSQLGVSPRLITIFGCLKCTWAGTKLCSHDIKPGGHHNNYICTDRLRHLQKRLEDCGTMTRLFQQEEIFKLTQISEHMLFKYSEEGELPDDFKHISKLIISLTDKMRRQDEGIKMQGEFTVDHEKFREMMDVEAKVIEERNNRTRQAEVIEQIPDNRQEA